VLFVTTSVSRVRGSVVRHDKKREEPEINGKGIITLEQLNLNEEKKDGKSILSIIALNLCLQRILYGRI